jgi:hypothetical protein
LLPAPDFAERAFLPDPVTRGPVLNHLVDMHTRIQKISDADGARQKPFYRGFARTLAEGHFEYSVSRSRREYSLALEGVHGLLRSFYVADDIWRFA